MAGISKGQNCTVLTYSGETVKKSLGYIFNTQNHRRFIEFKIYDNMTRRIILHSSNEGENLLNCHEKKAFFTCTVPVVRTVHPQPPINPYNPPLCLSLNSSFLCPEKKLPVKIASGSVMEVKAMDSCIHNSHYK